MHMGHFTRTLLGMIYWKYISESLSVVYSVTWVCTLGNGREICVCVCGYKFWKQKLVLTRVL